MPPSPSPLRLVAVYEWMILGQALPKRSRLLNDVSIVTTLRPRQRGFDGPTIPNAEGTPELCDHTGMDGDDLVKGWVASHLARRSSSSVCCSINSLTAALNDDDAGDGLRFRNSMNCLTDSCSSGVSEPITSARFRAAMLAFHPQYTPAANRHYQSE
jgi:hypothetical protein